MILYRHDDYAEVPSDSALIQRLPDERGTFLNRYFLHLQIDISALGRKFYKIDHGRFQNRVGYPQTSDMVRGYDPVGPRPE